jgi:hypothetical protein
MSRGIVAVYLLGIGALVASRRRDQTRPAPPELARVPWTPPPALPPTTIYAYVYQLPSETAVRMAFGPFPSAAREMGIFGKYETARDLAARKGWALAWPGVREL